MSEATPKRLTDDDLAVLAERAKEPHGFWMPAEMMQAVLDELRRLREASRRGGTRPAAGAAG